MEKPTAEKRKNVNLLLDQKMLEEIDEYRWRNRLPSRTDAIRSLIEAGLKVSAKVPKAK